MTAFIEHLKTAAIVGLMIGFAIAGTITVMVVNGESFMNVAN